MPAERHPWRAAAAPVALCLPLWLAAPAPAAPAELLRIGVAVETSGIDPHLSASQPNAQALRHVFEPLVAMDAAQRPVPGLAVSWELDRVDPRRWVFRLRPGVRFHDGQPFGAEDVAASLRRAMDPPGGVGGYASYLRQVVGFTVLDEHTLELRTAAPHPALPFDLTAPMIVSRHAAAAPPDAFSSGQRAAGTGPYRFAGWRRGTELLFERNPAWWGEKPAWARVQMLPRSQDGARVAALLAGEVDLIDQVPTTALETIRGRPDLRLSQAVTSRLIFLALDAMRPVTPFMTDSAGRPLQPNPLRDPLVRRALSLALDRGAIVSQVMGGMALPAGQLLPPGMIGTDPSLLPDPHDPAEARRLLRQAGVPEGARLVLHGPNDRYLNDEKVLVAVAGMLRRVGLAAEPVVAPFSVFRARQRRHDASMTLNSWGTETGDASLALRALLGAPGRPTGWGQVNFLGYANEAFESALATAMREADEPARLAALARATGIAMADRGVLPLYFQHAVWASNRGVDYRPRRDEYTLAISAHPAR
ncbi:ABC transporter substrate-binding protein [Falsiroseomonas sp.]|uniref:ABC transporter substrate-binding protein n=1 Tax=Falsiroseomonas sp. TaxID=2870721 RepID=UPI003569BED6